MPLPIRIHRVQKECGSVEISPETVPPETLGEKSGLYCKPAVAVNICLAGKQLQKHTMCFSVINERTV